MKSMKLWLRLLPFAVLLPLHVVAQQPPQAARADYERAALRLGAATEPLVLRADVRPEWLERDRFWYRVRTADGHEFVLVDPVRGTRERAFDHERLARALTEATGTEHSPWALPLQRLAPVQDGRGLGFELDRRRWDCDVVAYRCERPATRAGAPHGRGALAGRPAGRVPPRRRPLGARGGERSGDRDSRPTARRATATPPTTRGGAAASGRP
jgi:hypothetical protein